MKYPKRFLEDQVKILQNDLFNLGAIKEDTMKMQFLALNVMNNGEKILKDINDNKQKNNLNIFNIRKYFLQKVVELGGLEYGRTYNIDQITFDIFKFAAQEIIQSN